MPRNFQDRDGGGLVAAVKTCFAQPAQHFPRPVAALHFRKKAVREADSKIFLRLGIVPVYIMQEDTGSHEQETACVPLWVDFSEFSTYGTPLFNLGDSTRCRFMYIMRLIPLS